MQKLNRNSVLKAAMVLAPALVVGCLDAPKIDYAERSPIPGIINLDDQPPGPPPVVDGLAVFSGQAKDIVTNAPLEGLTLGTYGITPPASGETDGVGFALDVQAAGEMWVYASGPAHTRTYNQITMPAADYVKDIYVLSTADLDAIALANGVTLEPGCAHLVVRVKNAAGQNQDNVEGITLTSEGLFHDVRGPYFLNDQNQADPAATYTSTAGKAVFLNICDTGQNTLALEDTVVRIDDPAYAGPDAIVKIFGGYVTRVEVNVVAGAPPPPPPPAPVYDFPNEIYPVFARNQCGTCHQAGGAAAGTGLYLNDGPENVFDRLVTNPTNIAVVNIQNPAASLILTKPLVEEPPNHPNGAFTSPQHPDYLLLYNWIQGGAVYGVNPPPPPVVNLSYNTDIHPIFAARTCTGCHNAVDLDGGLDLSGAPQDTYNFLQANGLYDVNYPDRGGILRNPYCGPNKCAADPQYPETHPVEVFLNENDPDYVKLYQWQLQGALYEYNPNIEPDPVNVIFQENVGTRWAALGCTGCHGTDNGQAPSAGLDLQDYPSNAYASLLANNALLPNNYEGSTIYTKPNAEYPDVNHSGGKAVANSQDNYARYVRAWIQEGGNFVDQGPIDFATDVYPIFGANALNCQGCHSIAQAQGGLVLEGAPADIQQTVDALITADDVANSEIATKGIDLYPEVNHGGPKRAIADYYKEWSVLQWYIREK